MGSLLGRPVLPSPEVPPYQPFEVHPRAFTPKQCERIIALGRTLESTTALIEGEEGAEIVDEEIRRSRTAWIPPDDTSWWIYERLAAVAERANRRYGFDLSGFGEDLQFTTYEEPGAFYSWHQDGLDGDVATRKLSIVIQLSDPEEYVGSEVQWFEVAEDYDEEQLDECTRQCRQQGAALVFPAFEYHRVLPLRAGVRHSLVSWVSGPPFR